MTTAPQSIPINIVRLPADEARKIKAEALASARRFGISDDEWQAWRSGKSLGRDMLMILDPEREAERIRVVWHRFMRT